MPFVAGDKIATAAALDDAAIPRRCGGPWRVRSID
jgi:hypothetical protein